MTPQELITQGQNELVSYIKLSLQNDKPSKWYTETWGFVQSMNKVKPVYEESILKDIFEDLAQVQKKINDQLSNKPSNPEKDLQQLFIKDKVKGTYELALYLTQKYNMVTVGHRFRETYIYQEGIYIRAENTIIFPEIQRILANHINKNAKSETFHKIQDATSKEPDIFDLTPPHLIPVNNGVYNILTKELLPHSPTYYFKHKLPVSYNATAICPKIDKFLREVFTDVQLKTVEEWMGYCCYRTYMYKKALIIVGDGDTGKTTFLELLTAMIGEENKSGISLHKIASDKFSSAQLYGKHVNIFDELSAEDVHDTANFKIATGGGSIMGEYKYGDQFSFKNYSKLMFACNKIPDVKDMNDEAYFNRWMVIHLEKTIKEKVTNLIAQLTTTEELSGLFNVAMTALERLLLQDGFSYKTSGIDTKLEMMRSASALANFVTEKIVKTPGADLTKEELYNAYALFCDERNLAPETIHMIGKKLTFYAPYITEGRMYTFGNKGHTTQVRGWRNVSLVKSDEELSDLEQISKWTTPLTNSQVGL